MQPEARDPVCILAPLIPKLAAILNELGFPDEAQ